MKRKATRRALVMSLLSLLLCMSMLVGTTFAWFTDSVTSGVNKIVAGNLDVDAYVGDPADKQSILGEDELFKDVTLWEPGALAYENITVANLGTLALKYELTVAFANENTVNGYGLSDILSVGVVFGKAESITSREAAIETVNDFGQWQDMDDFAFQGTLEAGDLAETLTIVIYWEPSAEDNNYNVNNGKETSDGEALHIDLGIAVNATQLTFEEDSFGPDYDDQAEYGPIAFWDGTVPATQPETLTVDPTTKTITVADAAALMYLTTLDEQWGSYVQGANAYYYSWEWTVVLETGVDFGGQTIQTIPLSRWGALEGNENVIKNVNINGTGLFALNTTFDVYELTLKNITVNGAGQEAVGALAAVGGSAYDVRVTDSRVVGNKYAGGLFGKVTGELDHIVVQDSTVMIPADGEKTVGGVVGYLITDGLPEDRSFITNSASVGNLISGPYNVGGLVGQLQAGSGTVTMANCQVTECELHYYNDPGTSGSDRGYGIFAARLVGDAALLDIRDNAELDNVVYFSPVYVATAADLQNALDNAVNGQVIYLTEDVAGDVTATQKPDVKVTLDGMGNTFAGSIIVDGKSSCYEGAGLTIQNIDFAAESLNHDAFVNLGKSGDNNTRYTANVTVQNCTFTGAGAVGIKSYTGGDKNLVVTGCTATEAAHSLIQAKGIDGILIENCKVYSKNGMNFNNSDNVQVVDCTVDVKGYAVRFGESSGGEGAAEEYLIKDCSLKSANNDGDATIILRGTADYSTLTIENTTIVGTPDIQNNATGATVVK